MYFLRYHESPDRGFLATYHKLKDVLAKVGQKLHISLLATVNRGNVRPKIGGLLAIFYTLIEIPP